MSLTRQPDRQTSRNLLTVFHQRVLVLAFCTLLEVSRRFVEHLCLDMEIHLDDMNFAFIKHVGINKSHTKPAAWSHVAGLIFPKTIYYYIYIIYS